MMMIKPFLKVGLLTWNANVTGISHNLMLYPILLVSSAQAHADVPWDVAMVAIFRYWGKMVSQNAWSIHVHTTCLALFSHV